MLLSLIVSGCYVQSINTFYTEDARIDLPELTGEWLSEIQMGDSVTNKQITPWTFTTNTVSTYDPENAYSQLDATYFMVDGTYFMDSTAGQPQEGGGNCGNYYWFSGITLVHTLCKLEINTNSLTMTPLNLEWFTKRIDEGKLNLPYVKSDYKDSNYIFTATPEDWIAFLKIYKDDAGVFDPKLAFVFKKKSLTAQQSVPGYPPQGVGSP